MQIPVTAKTRIGIDHEDSYEFFASFAHQLMDAGCDKLIVHARKAWLSGLSPKQNRTIPCLHYDYVYRIKEAYPLMPVVINGNIQTIDEVKTHLAHVDGVMIGRLAYENPYALARMHHAVYPNIPLLKRSVILKRYFEYVQSVYSPKIPMSVLLKPILNIVHGMPNARLWKEEIVRIQRSNQFPSLSLIDRLCVVD